MSVRTLAAWRDLCVLLYAKHFCVKICDDASSYKKNYAGFCSVENSFRNWLIWFASTLQRPCKRKLAKLFASCPMWSRQSLPLPISRVLAQLWPQVCQVPQSRWSWCLTYTYFRVWLFMSLHNGAKVNLKLFFKVEKILCDSLDSIPSHSPSGKIQIVFRKVYLM